MDGCRVGQVKIVQVLSLYDGKPLLFKENLKAPAGQADRLDYACFAIHDACTPAASPFCFPFQVIIIAGLHDLVAGNKFLAAGFKGVKDIAVSELLQTPVELANPGSAAPDGRKHLGAPQPVQSVIVGQDLAAQLDDSLVHGLLILAIDEDKVGFERLVKLERISLEDPVRVQNDQLVGLLPVNLGQALVRHRLALEQVAQDLAGADRRQLIRVTDQEQAGARLDRGQQLGKEEEINHGAFIYDQGVAIKGIRCQPERRVRQLIVLDPQREEAVERLRGHFADFRQSS